MISCPLEPHLICEREVEGRYRSAIGNAKAIVDQTTKLKAKVNGAAQAAILGAAA